MTPIDIEGSSYMGRIDETTGYSYSLYDDDTYGIYGQGRTVVVRRPNGEVIREDKFVSLGAAINFIVKNSEASIELRRKILSETTCKTRGVSPLNKRRVDRDARKFFR